MLGKICLKGYTYSTSYIKGTPLRRYLRCCQFKKMGCRARAVQQLDSNEFVIFSHHNHPQDITENIVCEFLSELKTACQSGLQMQLKEIYQNVAKCYPEGAELKAFDTVRTSMSRWRKAETKNAGSL